MDWYYLHSPKRVTLPALAFPPGGTGLVAVGEAMVLAL